MASDHSPTERWLVAGTGLVLALSVGSVDICVALLNKPRGFESFSALLPSIVATSALVLSAYAFLWFLVRSIVMQIGLDRRAALSALAVFLGTVVTLALVVGLHTVSPSPQNVLKTAIVVALSMLMGAGFYALEVISRRSPTVRDSSARLLFALPVLLVEAVVYQWLQVYAIDRIVSLAAALAFIAFITAAIVTVQLSRRVRRWSAGSAYAVVALLLGGALAIEFSAQKPAAVQASAGESTGRPRRIVLITVDTLRADAISAYRSSAPRTPAIDALAGDGVLFEQARAAAPWTLPSLTSMMSGLLPAVHGATGFTSTVSNNIATVAEYLRDQGYQTAALVHNDLLNPKNGLSQGFGEYVEFGERWFGDSIGMRALQTVAPAWFPPPSWPSNDDQTDIVVGWLESHRDRNFFLWVHYFDPHAPYAPPQRFMIREPLPTIGPAFEGQKTSTQGYFVPTTLERDAIRSLYDGEVRYIDSNIARLTACLKRLHFYDDALIVFTSDHGEEFWEHGRLGHGHSMYDELLRVPLIVKMPGSQQRGRASAAVSTTSVAPTILDAGGIRYEPAKMSTRSLLPLIDGRAGQYEETPVISGAQILFDRREAVNFHGYKFIVSAVDGHEELFDLAADPDERHSVEAAANERIEEARRLLATETAQAISLRKRLRIDSGMLNADEDTMRRLRSLGYLK